MSGAPKDLTALLALLADETPEFDGDQRVLKGDDPFACVLHLIDQTVIPMALEISNGQGVLRLEVAGRRLSQLPGVIEHLSADDGEGVATAAACITSFADDAEGALRVRELAASGAGGADPAQSVSIKTLAAAAGRPLIDANAAPLDQFRARLDSAIIAAHVLKNAAVVEKIGDVAAFKASLTDLAKLIASSEAPHLILFEIEDETASLRGAITVGADTLAFAAHGLGFATIVSAFKASIPV